MIKPNAPIITGLPKIHKPNVPIRPLINFTTSPAYKISKTLNRWLMQNITLNNDYSIKNNLELVDKIRNVTIPNGAKFASFDVTNMYSNIPITETLTITKRLLMEQNICKLKIDDVIKLLNMITSQNYFQHNGNYYTQNEGLPMGSPLSGTLANIYLNNFETTHIHHNKNKYKNNIIYWHRYVDDILVLFQGSVRQLNCFHTYINSIHRNIKFTLEMEINQSINFLDLTVSNANHSHQFNIYRKTTQTNHTIHNTSYHPFQHKIAAYHHLIYRLNNIPLNEINYTTEFNTITQIAIDNGYTEKLIHKLNNKCKQKLYQSSLTSFYNTTHNDKKYIVIDFNHNTSNILHKIMHKHGYTIAYKTNHNLRNKLKPKSHNTVIDCGVYKLICNNCDMFYIGQTGRTFSQRFAEHIQEVDSRNTNTIVKSNYAQHLLDEEHTFSNMNENLQILHNLTKGSRMDRYEEFEIYKNRHNTNLMNDKINTKANKLYDLLL